MATQENLFSSISDRKRLFEQGMKHEDPSEKDVQKVCLKELTESGRVLSSLEERRRTFDTAASGSKSEVYRRNSAQNIHLKELTESGHCLVSLKERRRNFETAASESGRHQSNRNELVTLAAMEGEEFKVNNQAIQNFLKNDNLKGRPIVIISIAGAFRSGKSFIMNFFIRYLKEKGWRNSNWFGDDKTPIIEGFEWRRGSQACTKGIHVWSDIYNVPITDGREAAVVLMDTQGLFDGDTSPDTNAKIMSISTLFSSHQLLNLMRQIEERDLEHLQLCVAFSKAAISMSGNKKPFQALTFLVRDWEREFEHELGDSTYGYLDDYFGGRSSSEEVQKVKDSIPAAFNDVQCFLLPRPGKKITRSDGENLMNKDMDEDFQDFTKKLVEHILNPHNLVVKRTKDGREATAEDVLSIIRNVGNSFASGELPKAKTLLQYMAGTNNSRALSEATSAYKVRMGELRRCDYYGDMWNENHERSLKLAEIQFRYMANIGEESSKLKYLSQLRKNCEEELEKLKLSTSEPEPNNSENEDETNESEFVKNYKRIDSSLKMLLLKEKIQMSSTMKDSSISK